MNRNHEHKNFYEVLSMDKEKDILIVDPYALCMSDLRDLKVKNIVRLRRPFWGTGRLSEFINKIEPEEFEYLLRRLTAKEKP